MDKHEYEAHIDRIISSKGFGRSKTYARLLKYIVKSSQEGEIPKETSIAIDVFGKDKNYNPSEDTLVRVYVHNLRKKLSHYYEHEGKTEPHRILIPKGKYEAVISEPLEEISSNSHIKIISSKWLWGLGVLIVGVFALNMWLFSLGAADHEVSSVSQTKIWKPFSEGIQEELSIVMGDIFLFTEYDSVLDQSRMIRDSRINSEEDLDALIEEYPSMVQRNIAPAENPLLTKSQVLSLKEIVPLANNLRSNNTIRIMSRMNSEELRDKDVIFIGLFKTLGLLEYVFDSSHFQLTSTYAQIIHKTTGEVIFQEGNPLSHHVDYGYLAKVQGPDNHQIIIVSSFTDTGILQVINQITQIELVEELEQSIIDQLGKVPDQWEALFEVGGYDRTNLTAQLKYVYER